MEFTELLLKAKEISPEIIISITALTVIFADMLVSKTQKVMVSMLAIIGLLFAYITLIGRFNAGGTFFKGMIEVDTYASIFKMIFILSALLVAFISVNYLSRFKIGHGEFYGLMLFATLGAMIMSSAADFVSVYIGLELLSISLYILVGLMAFDLRSNEAAMKYFLTGIFASAVFVYGLSLIYGFSGQTNFEKIAMIIKDSVGQVGISGLGLLPVIGMVFVAVGFGFKISAVPFHMWTPDVYEGAPTPVTAFLSSVPKVAGVAVILRIFLTVFSEINSSWVTLFAVLSVLTMTVGNIMALRQDSVKRMLAYSSIAHVGYILTGFVAIGVSSEAGIGSIAFYFLAYLFMNIGAFSILIYTNAESRKGETFAEIKGLSTYAPFAAAAMAIFMFSLAGIPPLAGFIAKYWIFTAVIRSGYTWLAIISVLNSALSAYYYLRVVKVMYLDSVNQKLEIVASVSLSFAVLVMVALTLILGIFPQVFMRLTEMSMISIF